MSEITTALKPDPKREAERADLWERYRALGVKMCCELRMDLQNDPLDHGMDYPPQDIQRWAEEAEKASAELDSLLSATHEFMSRRCLPTP